MKKILALSLLSVPLFAFAETDFGATVPQWSDFAPKAFVDVKEPKGLAKLNVNSKYWYARKVAFEEAISDCKALENNEDRFNCYDKVKTKQYRLNDDYNARLEAEMKNVSGSSIPGMENRTDTMLPLGGYFNNMTNFMPNEFR